MPATPTESLNPAFTEMRLVRAQDAQQAHALFRQWQVLAAKHGIALRQPPPAPTTCCGRGCNGCVWEGWFDAVWFWQEDAQAALLQAAAIKPSDDPQPSNP